MSQPTVAVLDTATGRRREAWVYAAGEMVAARQAAEAMQGARSAKAFAPSPAGQYEVFGTDGGSLGRFDLVDAAAPVAAVSAPSVAAVASAVAAAASPPSAAADARARLARLRAARRQFWAESEGSRDWSPMDGRIEDLEDEIARMVRAA